MTELEHAIKHIKTRADAWAVKVVEEALSEWRCIYDLKNRYCPRLDENGMLKELEQQPKCDKDCEDMTREEAIKELSKLIFELGFEDNVDDKVYALNMAIQALSQEPCKDAEQIDYHDDFETASRKIHDYEERQKQNDKKCGSYNNTNTFKSCCDCKLIGTDSCYMVCGGSKSLYKPKQKSEPCAEEHRQLVTWLKDYKRLLEQEAILEQIRDEIANLTCDCINGMVNQYAVLQIIDKYMK